MEVRLHQRDETAGPLFRLIWIKAEYAKGESHIKSGNYASPDTQVVSEVMGHDGDISAALISGIACTGKLMANGMNSTRVAREA